MTQASISIGSKIRITRVRDRIPQSLVDLLKQDSSGTVKEFRTVDGKGIGVVVELSNGSTSWFFEDEIAAA
ncbi:MAG: cytochrome b6f subunit PetP [Synechococcus sp.]